MPVTLPIGSEGFTHSVVLGISVAERCKYWLCEKLKKQSHSSGPLFLKAKPCFIFAEVTSFENISPLSNTEQTNKHINKSYTYSSCVASSSLEQTRSWSHLWINQYGLGNEVFWLAIPELHVPLELRTKYRTTWLMWKPNQTWKPFHVSKK